MMYSLVHITLLAAATLGLWLVRSRMLIAAACFLVFPLPAVLFSLYAVPNPLPSLVSATDPAAGDCIRRPGPPADGVSSDTPEDAGKSEEPNKTEEPGTFGEGSKSEEGSKTSVSPPDCPPPRDTSRGQTFFAVISVNYLTVLIGFAAGLLARKPSSRRPADRGRGAPPR